MSADDTFVDLEPTAIRRSVVGALEYDAVIVLPFWHANFALDALRNAGAKCGTNNARCDYVVESLDHSLVILSTRFAYIVDIVAQAANFAQLDLMSEKTIAQATL